jgi:hypothetical protein
LSLKSVSLVGATLGPLGLMVTIMLGILESSRRRGEDGEPRNIPMTVVAPVDDPFA